MRYGRLGHSAQAMSETSGASLGPAGAITTVANEAIQVPLVLSREHISLIQVDTSFKHCVKVQWRQRVGLWDQSDIQKDHTGERSWDAGLGGMMECSPNSAPGVLWGHREAAVGTVSWIMLGSVKTNCSVVSSFCWNIYLNIVNVFQNMKAGFNLVYTACFSHDVFL